MTKNVKLEQPCHEPNSRIHIQFSNFHTIPSYVIFPILNGYSKWKVLQYEFFLVECLNDQF